MICQQIWASRPFLLEFLYALQIWDSRVSFQSSFKQRAFKSRDWATVVVRFVVILPLDVLSKLRACFAEACLQLRFLNQSTGSSTFDFCNMLLIAAAHSSQSSCNSFSTFLPLLFGTRVELDFKSIPVWKAKLVVSADLPAP